MVPHCKKDFWGSLGLVLTGLFSLGYVLFDRPFAEWNIQFPFLDFPVFIGEILLMLCLWFFLNKAGFSVTKKNFWIIGYFAFVIIKALVGYFKFGPLAFRDAALFYYPAFIIFANSFYRRDFFNAMTNFLFLIIIIFLLTRQGFNEYWVLTCFSLGLILSYSYPHKILKGLFLAAIFLLTPYKLFFNTSRMMMVGNFVAGIYLVIGLYLIWNVSKKIKGAFVVLSILCLVGAFFSFSDRNAIRGIFKAGKIVETFKEYDRQIGETEQQSALEESITQTREKVRIYNPNQPIDISRLSKKYPFTRIIQVRLLSINLLRPISFLRKRNRIRI